MSFYKLKYLQPIPKDNKLFSEQCITKYLNLHRKICYFRHKILKLMQICKKKYLCKNKNFIETNTNSRGKQNLEKFVSYFDSPEIHIKAFEYLLYLFLSFFTYLLLQVFHIQRLVKKISLYCSLFILKCYFHILWLFIFSSFNFILFYLKNYFL